MDSQEQKKLKGSIFRTLLRIEDIAQISIGHRRSFLLILFSVTAASVAGLFVVDLKFDLSNLSFLGIGIISLNLFIIPIYLWYASRKELNMLSERYIFWYNQYNKKELISLTPDEKRGFDNIYKEKKNRGKDIVFDMICFVYILGLVIFIASLPFLKNYIQDHLIKLWRLFF